MNAEKQERPLGIWACSSCSCSLWVPSQAPIGPCPACGMIGSWIDSRLSRPEDLLNALHDPIGLTSGHRFRSRSDVGA